MVAVGVVVIVVVLARGAAAVPCPLPPRVSSASSPAAAPPPLPLLQAFATQYATIHRLETNKLRNVAKFFAHLLHTDALPWTCFEYIRLGEEETSSASRIFIKILFQVSRVVVVVIMIMMGMHQYPLPVVVIMMACQVA